MPRAVVMVMAGGRGTRLAPLTCHRAKPAVPFGGRYRIVDFVMSNLLNSGYRRIFVLTQFMASSLIRHIARNWHLVGGIDEFIEIVPAQMRMGDHWYRGTADAVWQNVNLLRDACTEHVAIFGGDHVYKFAVDQMERRHLELGADLTVSAIPVPVDQARHFGCIEVDRDGRVRRFVEKPERDPPTLPDRPDTVLASMGNYFFRVDALEEALAADAEDPDSGHDFGHDVIPRMVAEGRRVFVYDFADNRVPGEPPGTRPYWRDVGTIDSYFQANMELRSPLPALNLYNRRWRIRTATRDYPPARFVQAPGHDPSDCEDTLVCEGSIVQSAVLREVLLGYDCFVRAGAEIEQSVLLSGCDIGEGARIRRAILDKNCTVEAGAEIGLDPEADRERFPFVTASGLVVLPKGTHVPRRGPLELARDMAEILLHDPIAGPVMRAFEGRYVVSPRRRHSAHSAGPRTWS